MYESGIFFICGINSLSLYNFVGILVRRNVVTPLLPAFPKCTYTP